MLICCLMTSQQHKITLWTSCQPLWDIRTQTALHKVQSSNLKSRMKNSRFNHISVVASSFCPNLNTPSQKQNSYGTQSKCTMSRLHEWTCSTSVLYALKGLTSCPTFKPMSRRTLKSDRLLVRCAALRFQRHRTETGTSRCKCVRHQKQAKLLNRKIKLKIRIRIEGNRPLEKFWYNKLHSWRRLAQIDIKWSQSQLNGMLWNTELFYTFCNLFEIKINPSVTDCYLFK